jgi:nucleotide-binding universal stress UspA family protein
VADAGEDPARRGRIRAGPQGGPATIELARVDGGTVRVVHVREVYHPLPPTVVGDSPKEVQALVDGVVAKLQQAGVTAEGAVRPTVNASPASAILEEIRDVDAGMIVLGSRGLSDLGGLLLGSVAHKVIQLSTCPVLVVRDEQSSTAWPWPTMPSSPWWWCRRNRGTRRRLGFTGSWCRWTAPRTRPGPWSRPCAGSPARASRS